MQYFHITNKRGPYLFPFAFFKPQSLLDFHGPVLHLSNHVNILRYTPFPSPPPTLGGGTYAIIGKRSHREFCIRNLHTYFLVIVKFWSVGRNTLKLPLIETRTTDINTVERICIQYGAIGDYTRELAFVYRALDYI